MPRITKTIKEVIKPIKLEKKTIVKAKVSETKKKVGRKRKSDTYIDDKMGCVPSKKAKLEDEDHFATERLNKSEKLIEKQDSADNDRSLASVSSKAHVGKLDDWNHVDYVYETSGVSKSVVGIVIQLFDNDNTIPFIARYRKSQTGNLDADKLRFIKENYDRAKAIKHKAETVIKSIEKSGKGSAEIYNTVKLAKTLNELEEIHGLYKTGAKRTVAGKARELGLGAIANALLLGDKVPLLRILINSNTEGLESEEQIKEHIIAVIADNICKDKNTFEKIKELRKIIPMKIETIETVIKQSATANTTKKNGNKNNDNERDKYKMYYSWTSANNKIQSYQVLAINRAEKEKIISVQVIVPNCFEIRLKKCILELFKNGVNASPFHSIMISSGFELAYKKSIKPAIIRRTRSEMSERAEEASMEVFARNVKQLLLTQPVRGKIVLGIDPGFAHGCKLAAVSTQGDVLETATIYPHKKGGKWHQDAADTLAILVRRHQISMIALGNGTACRDTENFLSGLIKSGVFGKQGVTYAIVDEAGASVYSCSSEAKSEFPRLDYNVISAVSIARKLQDPLAELVKVEPKHLGVGMYQHDLPEKRLMCKLNEVVIEAVSFVGVDVNTASHSLLRRVAGLSELRAANIIEWRKTNGPFINREQLRKVKGIGNKTFEQCAGFIRILPDTAVINSSQRCNNKTLNKTKFNYLDQTWIHPESYNIANAFIQAANLNLEELGIKSFISSVKIFASTKPIDQLAKQFSSDLTTLEVIIKGLSMAKGEDIRTQNNAPLFRKSLRNIDDLTVGALLSGEIRNIVDFGVFVDVGVGVNGLLHVRHLKGTIVEIGQRINVKVNNLEKQRKRIGLELV